MPEAKPFDWSVFSWPRMLFAETVVANNATVFVQSDALKAGRDMLIDYVAISEETYSLGVGAANSTYMNVVNADWWIHDRARYMPQGPAASAITVMDNMYAVDRTANPTAALTAGRGMYMWRHPVRWAYDPQHAVNVDWLNPATLGAATGALTAGIGMHGVGVVTGHRRVFYLAVAMGTNAAGAAQGSTSNTQTMGNPGDQPYLVEDTEWVPADAQWAVFNDNRIANHVRFRIKPTNGDAWSDIPVPGIFYGIHRGQPSRTSWYQPTGGPILLRRNNQMVFEITNAGAGFALNVQVCLIGRVAPGISQVV